ncbi:hypothetical protein [Alkalibacterium sp. 20]|uniref:hypothetical protein n=1 Tax=Alkalibacterium sp. 20 TaxID=1798803 RepID=UPI00090025FC|nr:hypothetical protein [Alkalibacterium sp. 20]OJF94019.1 hypothetical protein AX762_08090 [Alkalibacterium sp. 20]
MWNSYPDIQAHLLKWLELIIEKITDLIESQGKLGQLIVTSIPASVTVMAILLANNICDLEGNIEDDRFTLAYPIGVDKALLVFKWF